MEWLGHLVRMPSTRIPRQLLFSSLPFPRPFCGPRLRWKDVAVRHIAAAGVPADRMVIARDRRKCREEVVPATTSEIPQVKSVACETCDRFFRRHSDLKRHKCHSERQLLIHLQAGAIQCNKCNRWFASKGGLAVHACSATADQCQPTHDGFLCVTCQRILSSVSGFRRHNCHRGQHRPTTADRSEFDYCCPRCLKHFRRSQDLKRHSGRCL